LTNGPCKKKKKKKKKKQKKKKGSMETKTMGHAKIRKESREGHILDKEMFCP